MRNPGKTFRGTPPPLDGASLALQGAIRRDVQVLAAEIGERNVTVPRGYARAAQYIEDELRKAGHAPVRQTFEVDGVACSNIEAEKRGTSEEIVVIGAHYDSVYGSPGADDNASGVAAMLALARAFAKEPAARTVRFVAFANEEPPHFQSEAMGSYRYAKRCRDRNEKITAMMSLETIGYFSDAPRSQKYPAMLEALYPGTATFVAFASNIASRRLMQRALAIFREHAMVGSEGAALPEAVPGIAWSDQWAFWRMGYPAVMVTDTALFRNPHYHTSHDTIETLDYARLTRVVEGLQPVVRSLAND